MRFVRFLCNVGIFLVSYFMIFAVGIMAYTAVSWGVSSDEAIHFVSSDTQKVRFYDAWAFQGKDIGISITSEPKPYVRNMFGGNGKWADTAINFVGSIFKPIIVPHAQIDNLAEQRTTSLYEDLTGDINGKFGNHMTNLSSAYTTPEKRYGAFIELATFNFPQTGVLKETYLGVEKIFNEEELKELFPTEGESAKYYLVFVPVGADYIIAATEPVHSPTTSGTSLDTTTITKMDVVRKHTIKTNEKGNKEIHYELRKNELTGRDEYIYEIPENTNSVTIGQHDLFTQKKINFSEARKADLFDDAYQKWVIDKNDALGNRMWQSFKYNDRGYDEYVIRFLKLTKGKDVYGREEILLDANGKPIIKTEVIFLCVIEWISLIVAAIFTIRYPVTVIQARITERRNRKKGGGNTGVVI